MRAAFAANIGITVEQRQIKSRSLNAARSANRRSAYEHQKICGDTGDIGQGLLRKGRETGCTECDGFKKAVEDLEMDRHVSQRFGIIKLRYKNKCPAGCDQHSCDAEHELSMFRETLNDVSG